MRPHYVVRIGIFGGACYRKVVHVAPTLHEAAAYLLENWKPSYSLFVRSGETSARWSYAELKSGGYFHDCAA
jgi:hypothetical protein